MANKNKQAEAEVVPSSSLVEIEVKVNVGVEVGFEIGAEVGFNPHFSSHPSTCRDIKHVLKLKP